MKEKKEETIKSYFNSWVANDETNLNSYFAEEIIYIESFGPAYSGIDQIYRWFRDWHKHGKVLVWDIKQFIYENNVTVCEWYFQCEYDGKLDSFDGVSLITFNDEYKITELKEFQAKTPCYYPYREGVKS